MLLDNMKKHKRWLQLGAFLLATSLISHSAMAAKMRAQCYLLDKDSEAVQGVDIHHPYEIASVSKIFTSFWALSTYGANYRFPTKFYIRPIADGAVDLHIEGSWDPYFNRDQFQYLITQLNALNVTRINNLTFDENFKFVVDSRGMTNRNVPIGHYQLNDPTPQRVLANLKYFTQAISTGYANLRVQAKAIQGISLPATLKMKIGSVRVMTKENFAKETDFIQSSRQMVLESSPLYQILKEMNRNSNNYVANLLFQSLGGAEPFQKFITTALKTEVSEIQFVNGSGDRLDLMGGKSAYNKASCDAIVKTIAEFRASLQQQDMELESVMALAGEDPSAHERSTVSNIYGNEATADALIAKTGTVNPSVTLAGMASTEEGDVYFGIIYGTNGRKADWTSARTQIRRNVMSLFKKFNNKKEIDYDPTRFMVFDKDSHLREVNVSTAETPTMVGPFTDYMMMKNLKRAQSQSMDIIYSDWDTGKLP